MGFVKGNDGKARSVKNPLEGSIGDADLGAVTFQTISISGNISTANILTDGYRYANGTAVSFGSGNVLANAVSYSQTNPGDWPTVLANVQAALDSVANTVSNIETGAGFSFSGPFSNDATAGAGGVAIGQVYFNNSGGLVVRQT